MDKIFFNRRGREKYADDVVPVEKTGYFALLIKDHKVLLTYPPQVNVPEFPGGSCKRREDFRDCLFRKLYEETGVEFMLDKGETSYEQTVNYFADDERPDGTFYIYRQIFIVYDASSYGFDIDVPRWKTPENGYAQWVDLEDIFEGRVKVNYCHWQALSHIMVD